MCQALNLVCGDREIRLQSHPNLSCQKGLVSSSSYHDYCPLLCFYSKDRVVLRPHHWHHRNAISEPASDLQNQNLHSIKILLDSYANLNLSSSSLLYYELPQIKTQVVFSCESPKITQQSVSTCDGRKRREDAGKDHCHLVKIYLVYIKLQHSA